MIDVSIAQHTRRYLMAMTAVAVGTVAAVGGARLLYEGAGPWAGKALMVTIAGFLLASFASDLAIGIRREIRKLTSVQDSPIYGVKPTDNDNLWK